MLKVSEHEVPLTVLDSASNDRRQSRILASDIMWISIFYIYSLVIIPVA